MRNCKYKLHKMTVEWKYLALPTTRNVHCEKHTCMPDGMVASDTPDGMASFLWFFLKFFLQPKLINWGKLGYRVVNLAII